MKVTGQNVNRTIGNPSAETSKADKSGKSVASDLGKANSAAANGIESLGAAKVNVSGRAQAMQKAKEIAGDQSIDEAKVARLQKMIDAGEYQMDSKAIADKMVDAHMLFPE